MNENIELPGPYNEIIHIVGREGIIEIAKVFGGSKIYFPKLQTLTKPQRNEKILQEYNGYNTRELARRYDLSENRIRQICKDKITKTKNKPVDGQISIFDL